MYVQNIKRRYMKICSLATVQVKTLKCFLEKCFRILVWNLTILRSLAPQSDKSQGGEVWKLSGEAWAHKTMF